MTADDIILEAERLGITLRLCDGKIIVKPLSTVTETLAASIRVNKRELRARLRERELKLLPGAKLIQLTLPKLEAPTAAPTEPAAALVEACEHFNVALWLDAENRLVLGRFDQSGKEPGIPPTLAVKVQAQAGEIVQWLKALRRPLELPTEIKPTPAAARQMHGTPYRVRMDEFGNCDICGEPAGMVNVFGRFCGLRCFRVWQGTEGEALATDAVTLDPAVEAELTRIWPEAERFGWNHSRIWNANFWPNTGECPRGLASVLQAGDPPEPPDTIVEVTRDYLVIERTEVSFVKTDGVIARHERKTWMRFPKDGTAALEPREWRPPRTE
jgi:hypothetical protein